MDEQLNKQEIERQKHLWIDNWARMMIQIWQDKLQYWNINRTGALSQSFTENVAHEDIGAHITLRFLSYGIYQAFGVGNHYVHDNGGDLKFLDKAYRIEHRLNEPRRVGPAWGGYYTSGEPRQKRDWFSPKLFASLMRMKETIAHMVGEESAAVICEALENANRAVGKGN